MRHLAIKYFYVIDKVNDEKVSIVYKPTYDMVSDFLTKKLQSKLFPKHREALLGFEKWGYNTFYVKYKNMKGDQSHTHTHTHTHIYIYIYMYMNINTFV